MTPRKLVSGSVARARVAHAVFEGESDAVHLGRIDLAPHQVSAVKRLRTAIAEFGGALLCDPVGTGKTYIALGLASAGENVLVIAPAVLRSMWQRAAASANRTIEFISFESLSRGTRCSREFDLLIVDEAHHARNPSTHRFVLLAELASSKRVVLLTATPIHNRKDDLVALLSLFLGSRAKALTEAELSRCVVRRASIAASIAMPATDELIWCRIEEDDRIPSLLLGLPPPLPPRDAGDGGALVVHSLIRQWCSSDCALVGGLKRRLVRAEALISALSDGTWPSTAELKSWISGDDSVQLGFSELLAAPTAEANALLPVVEAHRDGIVRVLQLARSSLADKDRASLIRQIRANHEDRKIVVFTQYADSVAGMFSLLHRDGGVAALSGSGANVSGGSLSREDVISRFAPVATGSRPPRRAEEISLLLATDLMSEGVNLQDAGVVIHLDLPWTPARMEQRLGRVARIGSLHDRVISYALKPPASAATTVRIEEILRRKLRESGIVTECLASLSCWARAATPDDNAPLAAEALRTILRNWLTDGIPSGDAALIAAAVLSDASGFLAVLHSGDGPRLVACCDGRITEDLKTVLDCVTKCEGPDTELTQNEVWNVENRLGDWLDSRSAIDGTRASAVSSQAGKSTLRRIERVLRRSRPFERSLVAAKAERARQVVCTTLSAHGERELAAIFSEHDDIAWLDRLVANAPGGGVSISSDAVTISVILVLKK